MLLDRLFRFLKQKGDLNPVLSGYFSKLVSLLISRKQKLLIPYIFAADSDIIDHMVRHVGQKSISEILNKLITQIDQDYMADLIQKKQLTVVEKLIAHLGPDKHEENNLNACTILQDMFEHKEYFNILIKKENFQNIVNMATAGIKESTKASKTSSLTVLNQILAHHIEKLKKKDANKEDKNAHDDDDMIVQTNSDDELELGENQVRVSQTNAMVDILIQVVPNLEEILKPGHAGVEMIGSFNDTPFTPLGQQRLRSVDLIFNMVKLRKEPLLNALGESQIFGYIMELVKAYPWNNFLQLKVINLCNDVISNTNNPAFRKQFLERSGIAHAFVQMSENASVKMESNRDIRNGYMALVIEVTKKLQNKYEGSDENKDTVIADYLDKIGGEEWRAYIDDEYKKSSENNNKTLGGCTRNNMSEDNDENGESSYDVQMEKIMQRFSNFNQILSEQNGNDDDDDDDEEDHQQTNYGEIGEDEDADGEKPKEKQEETTVGPDYGTKITPVVIEEKEDLKSEYSDAEYWKLQPEQDYDYDALLAELDS